VGRAVAFFDLRDVGCSFVDDVVRLGRVATVREALMMKSMLSRSVILLLAVLVSLSVTAAPVIMWEDFEDAGGAPAFDP